MKVVILCGGQGIRAYPLTRHLPKALLPVAGLPIVEQVMRLYAAQGFDEFVLATGHLRQPIVDYFRERSEWRVTCVDTGARTDTADRLRACLDHAGARFLATYCDGLGDVDLTALVAFHERHGRPATLTAVPLRSQYGVLELGEGGRVLDFAEKPSIAGRWMNAGFFVLDRGALAATTGTNLERDVLPALAAGDRLRAFRHDGFWRSLDTLKDQVELDAEWRPFAERMADRLGIDGVRPFPAWLLRRYRLATRG